ncbi:MAG: radical SAM protein [Elusimicrobia bacterium]|nr:radical SAM protein [Elusimicrobiota bacterium]
MTRYPQRVFFTWDIHYDCNYRCPHCFFDGKWEELSKVNRYPGTDKWAEVWEDIYQRYGSCRLHITGGEPFVYPDIYRLSGELLKRHSIGFDTNLSLDVEKFLANIDKPEKVSFSASFHPLDTDADEFINKLISLRNAGCVTGGLNYVAYPPALKFLSSFEKKAREAGFEVTVIPYRGPWEDRNYPEDYTPEERLRLWNEKPREENKDTSSDPTKTMLKWYGSDKNSREGLPCRMGEVYAKIHPDGTAHRCCMTWENWGCLGNLLDGTFKLYEEPHPCPYAKCACSFAMIVGEEERWKNHWENRMEEGGDDD